MQTQTQPQQIQPTTSLGSLVTANPATSRILLRHQLDFCCGGKQSLAEACAQAELDLDEILNELRGSAADATTTRWDQVAPSALVAHILEKYHAPLPEDLAQLRGMADKVLRVHGDKDPLRLSELALTVRKLEVELSAHMQQEETVLFPQIVGQKDGSPKEPIAQLHEEHETAGKALEAIKELTDGFVPPPEACATWSNLYSRLRAFDAELREHIHLENNILFPRVLADPMASS